MGSRGAGSRRPRSAGQSAPARAGLRSLRPSTAHTGNRCAHGAGVEDRVPAAAPDGVDAIIDMVGGDALRTVASLLGDRSQLTSLADKPLALELGGFERVRDRSTAVLTELARLVQA